MQSKETSAVVFPAPVSAATDPHTGPLSHAISAAPEQLITAPDRPYKFRLFDFGERGTCLSGELIQEIGQRLSHGARLNFPPVEAVVSPEPGGHMWGLLVAFQLGVKCYIPRVPSPIPTPGVAVARNTAYSRGELLMPPVPPGTRVLIVDDVVSSGGTLKAIIELLHSRAVEVAGVQTILAKGQKYRYLAVSCGIKIHCLHDMSG
jgi:adenine phosphoribosyltransferase